MGLKEKATKDSYHYWCPVIDHPSHGVWCLTGWKWPLILSIVLGLLLRTSQSHCGHQYMSLVYSLT